jgi:hypothetical protein
MRGVITARIWTLTVCTYLNGYNMNFPLTAKVRQDRASSLFIKSYSLRHPKSNRNPEDWSASRITPSCGGKIKACTFYNVVKSEFSGRGANSIQAAASFERWVSKEGLNTLGKSNTFASTNSPRRSPFDNPFVISGTVTTALASAEVGGYSGRRDASERIAQHNVLCW